MSLYVLDTDILTLYQVGHRAVCERCQACKPGELSITVISAQEQISGWFARIRKATSIEDLSKSYERLTRFLTFLSRLNILSFHESAIVQYETLKSAKLNIGKMDLRIASIVLVSQATLVTRNMQDFKRVPSLLLEDWSIE